MFLKKRSLVKFIENTSKDFSNIDILINNADFPLEWKIWLKNVHDISEVELINIKVDLIGSFRVTREIIKLMMKKKWSYLQYSSNPCHIRTYLRFSVLYSKSRIG